MFKTNEYFDGKVKSIAFASGKGDATIGAMQAGEYTFETNSIEYMTVTSGEMKVQLPNETEWNIYKPFETFIVEKNSAFKVKTEADTSYLCIYK